MKIGVESGEGCPFPRNFLNFLFQNGEFSCMPAWISYTSVEQLQPENVLVNK